MRYLLPLLFLFSFAPPCLAALIEYRLMDSLANEATDIVLCDEVQYVTKKKKGWAGHEYDYYEAAFTVVQAFKGVCRPDEQLVVEVDSLYTRRMMDDWANPTDERPTIPMGRALLFLTRDRERPEVRQLAMPGLKLIVNGEAYCYGQFMSNPGPLWLARMAPETYEISPTTPYSEKLLLKDLQAALAKPADLNQAILKSKSKNQWHRVGIRTDYQPAEVRSSQTTPALQEPTPAADSSGLRWLGPAVGAVVVLSLEVMAIFWWRFTRRR